MPILEVSEVGRNIAESFSLKHISFKLHSGQKLGIAGATGSGKSTLLKIIAGLDDADAGVVYFDSKKVKGPKYRLIPGQPGIAYLSQHYELRNHQRMEEILSYANTMTEEKAMQLFDLCKISHLLKRTTFQLSGGEKQRIALARLLLTAPRLLILDEPFSNLDLIHKSILKNILEDIGTELGLTCIIASHDPLDLLSWADKMIILKEGSLLQEDSPMEIYFKPVDVYAGALLGKYNLLNEATARLFDASLTLNGKNLFVRPEQFAVATKGNNGVAGIIEKIVFWGNYHELKIRIHENIISLITTSGDFEAGQKIAIQLKEEKNYWTL
ncbi:ABC transporter ATP-binding protein [Taibaiella lutea]|uniref:ABC transporter ATP-binding protein n=1 Tax=Taibaiella lutea TaxID=2608001 RepID=A0A5M6CH33_9BACT|nr:ABC transporter ATP-binding protein [Taibaiella lutea]KAA5532725.1 ABC transporter ATP-binding protein [Taibaiella lutea]